VRFLAIIAASHPMNSEDKLIERISRGVPSRTGRESGGLRLGIGDDAAVIRPVRGTELVLTCDAFLEGVHFLAGTTPDSVGYKSLARATSDLAAMGATPRFFLLTIALPKGRTGRWLDEFLRGMGRAARSLGMRLIGGDTTKSGEVAISITVVGEVAVGQSVTRSGARPGDLIYVSGILGRAQLGLELMLAGKERKGDLAAIVRPHLYPRIRVELGSWLARHGIASAMMDISDGLSTDLARLAEASGVGARLRTDLIPAAPVPEAVSRMLPNRRLDPLEMALHGGDDYELLFTVSRRKAKRLGGAPRFAGLSCIGEVTQGRRLVVVDQDGRTSALEPRGWDAFRRR
jgi:thiamine-monophosphate kinase